MQKSNGRGSAGLIDPQVSHEEKLAKLAEVAIQVGLHLARGQELVITAPLDTLPLVRQITEQAYRAGASLVTTLFTDEDAMLLRYRYAPDESFDYAAAWLQEGVASAYRSGAARLAISGTNPTLLAKEDPAKVSRANLAFSKASRPALDLITRHEINWTIVPCATPAWASAMFPDEPVETAMARLWDAIFASTRIDSADPAEAWRTHDKHLQARAHLLNTKRFAALQYRGPGTNLRVGLADDHEWLGGGTIAKNGIPCIPNMPTEEVFTTPHKDRVEGTVTSTKPLSYQGALIKDISVRFEKGSIVEARASTGESILQRMLETDDGARRLGEVALVPHSSPISQSGLLFLNTLFDENAASHIALGQAYSTCIRNGDSLDAEQLAQKGANTSLIHVDWMIGSDQIDVDGLKADGTSEPLMRRGEWV
ncbi:MAG TPA: aminopeptidase [Bryobacteraceae bacterium]|nr:aminopeptidase [Bryobacteraceae bacterium]